MPTEPDIIAILGCVVHGDKPSRALRTRLDRGLALFHRFGGEAVIFCLGGSHDPASLPEATVMARYLLQAGVPADQIVAEAYSATTEENLLHLRAILLDERYPKAWVGAGTTPDPTVLAQDGSAPPEKITIVTSRTHVPRTFALARHLGLNASLSGAPETLKGTVKNGFREVGATLLWGARAIRRTLSRRG